MVVSDPDIHRAARLNLERHRDEAVTKACDMVRNLKERGDNEAADTWLQIIARLSVAARVGVMEALATLRPGRFIRSASVYRNF